MSTLKSIPEWGIFILALLMYGLGFLYGHPQVMIGLFTVLILMEIIRTIYEYISEPHNRMKVRYIVDSAIFFGFRELFVGWLMLKTNLALGLVIMGVSLLALAMIIFFRTKVIKDSPENLDTFYTEKDKK